MQKICANPWCASAFEIAQDDLAFYDKISPVFNRKKESVPPPAFCLDCRQQRRLAMRNERTRYPRVCDHCKKRIIAIYPADSPFTVFCPACWWGDNWDPLSFGRAYDFSRPFFDQFRDLWYAVPKISILALTDNINSDYAHDGYRLQNCYLIFDGEQAQDSYYGEVYALLKDCCDFYSLKQCELCYECIHCQECFHLLYSRFCSNCSDSAFLLDCSSCRNCIGCVNLHQKEYHIFNEPVSKEEFALRKAAFALHTHAGVEALRAQAEALFLRYPRKATRTVMSEEVTGDNLISCKNMHDSYDCMDMRDCRHCTNCMMGGSDAQDVDAWGDKMNLVYNCAYVGAGVERLICCYYQSFGVSNLCYSIYCLQGANDCFGCVGLKKMRHCILNTQYTEEEYGRLTPKIIEQMRKEGTWGEFFPPTLSAFSYNETVAQDYYPLTKEEVKKRGWRWREMREEMPSVTKVVSGDRLPETIDAVPDDVLQWAIRCEVSGKLFKIQPSELGLYRKLHVPLPRRHFEVRHAARRALRNPRKLWKRACAKCGKSMETTYAPERPEIVYCESCYLKEVY